MACPLFEHRLYTHYRKCFRNAVLFVLTFALGMLLWRHVLPMNPSVLHEVVGIQADLEGDISDRTANSSLINDKPDFIVT